MKIKATLRQFYYYYKSRSFEHFSEPPFTTHLPILIGLSFYYEISSVLEFGSGLSSTVSFINKKSFPNINKITSYENNLEWYEKVKQKVSHDPRVSLIYKEGKISDCVKDEDIQNYDLVFIDDSMNLKDRSETIRNVIQKNPKFVAIHDFENSGYRKSLGEYKNTYHFKCLLPNTGVYSKEFDMEIMEKIESIINAHKRTVKPSEIEIWYDIFLNESRSGRSHNR